MDINQNKYQIFNHLRNFLLTKLFLFIYSFSLFLLGCTPQSEDKSITLISISSAEKEQIMKQVELQRKNLNLCNQERDQALSNNSVTIYPLKENQYLVEILCFLGAYQGNYQYLVGKQGETSWQKISFVTFRHPDNQLKLNNTYTLVGMTEFDELDQILTVESKTRGLGDCGSYVRYQWNENANFELKEYRHKSACDGVYLEPENYPLIYP